jgi:hypothetical protein
VRAPSAAESAMTEPDYHVNLPASIAAVATLSRGSWSGM